MTQDILKTRLFYDPQGGSFKWLNGKQAGFFTGGIGQDGYVRIEINGKKYSAHRLAFLWMNGSFPSEQIDHINNIRSDNRWSNLRPCSSKQNKGNQVLRRTNKTGHRGVHFHKRDKKFWASLQGGTKDLKTSKHLGYFDSAEEAAKAYNAAARAKYGEFFRE